jgi:hypothetical protein
LCSWSPHRAAPSPCLELLPWPPSGASAACHVRRPGAASGLGRRREEEGGDWERRGCEDWGTNENHSCGLDCLPCPAEASHGEEKPSSLSHRTPLIGGPRYHGPLSIAWMWIRKG